METQETSTVFISYSHDDDNHKNWVLQLATRLRSNGVDVIFDRWNLTLGADLSIFMEQGLSKSHRVICICSENYVTKADKANGGVGYEKLIITAKLLKDLNTNWVIPLIRNNSTENKAPLFLSSRLYIDFNDDSQYETNYESLIRELLDEAVLPIPPLGQNPFKTVASLGNKVFIAGRERYLTPSMSGKVTFDYSNNDGYYGIGQGKLYFETRWTAAGTSSIYIYTHADSIRSVAFVSDVDDISLIDDASIYDTSSSGRLIHIGQIAVYQNVNGYYAAIQVLSIKTRNVGSGNDQLTFKYTIQTNGSSRFSS